MVVIEAPSAWAASMVHDFTDSPSTSTVHAPQLEVSHPILVPVRVHASRRYCTSNVRGSTSWSCPEPLTLITIRMAGDLSPASSRLLEDRDELVDRDEGGAEELAVDEGDLARGVEHEDGAAHPDQCGSHSVGLDHLLVCLLYTSDAADDLPCVDLG